MAEKKEGEMKIRDKVVLIKKVRNGSGGFPEYFVAGTKATIVEIFNKDYYTLRFPEGTSLPVHRDSFQAVDELEDEGLSPEDDDTRLEW